MPTPIPPLPDPSRRRFLATGVQALALGLTAGAGRGALTLLPPGSGCFNSGADPLLPSHPLLGTEAPAGAFTVGGVRFADRWFGDPWSFADIPFHSGEARYPGGQPPPPQEEVDIAIVGGGLSGLAAAYLLRQHRPVVFEIHPRFGGTSVGETWRGTRYSLGGAYFITPDQGSFLEGLYQQLRLDWQAAVSPNTDDPVEVNGRIDPGFWDALDLPPDDRLAFQQYQNLVQYYVDNYPDIPLDEGADNAWILELDRLSLKQHVEAVLGRPAPAPLQAAIQGYCYSSFDAGWESISAASGWNFIAAEEFGRWVLPGGNAGLVSALWEALSSADIPRALGCPPRFLRPSTRVVEVRVLGPNRVRVVYKGADRAYRSLIAKRVVMAIPKHVCRQVLVDLPFDQQRLADLYRIHTAPYIVANVLVTRAVRRRFYDLFLLGNGRFPEDQGGAREFSRATDVVKGDFARGDRHNSSVLTFYWPLPYTTARFDIIAPDSLQTYAARFLAELDVALGALGLSRADIEQVRLARWGHAMPIAAPGLIADGVCQRIRAPFMDHIFFVCADNWALPAVETCLLEAEAMQPLIEAGL